MAATGETKLHRYGPYEVVSPKRQGQGLGGGRGGDVRSSGRVDLRTNVRVERDRVREEVVTRLACAGWAVDHDAQLLISDDLSSGPGATTLIATTLPVECAAAVDAVLTTGCATSALCEDELEFIVTALEAAGAGLITIGAKLAHRARQVPVLTPRQLEVVTQVVAGGSNRAIASVLHLSEATVKREVCAIARLFGTSTRQATADAAIGLGF